MLAGEAGFWEWTAATDHFYASPRLLEMGGFPPGTTFAGRSDSLSRTPYHPEDLARWNEATAAAFAGKRDRVEMEMRVLRSGETRWIHLDGLCTRDATGGVARWTGSAIDITERKQAEDALRLSEERYARAMEGSDAGHWDWNILTDEMFVSERARQMLALPAGRCRGAARKSWSGCRCTPTTALAWSRRSTPVSARASTNATTGSSPARARCAGCARAARSTTTRTAPQCA
jgi:PAS domain-containing protein